jgi:hypothetical protein
MRTFYLFSLWLAVSCGVAEAQQMYSPIRHSVWLSEDSIALLTATGGTSAQEISVIRFADGHWNTTATTPLKNGSYSIVPGSDMTLIGAIYHDHPLQRLYLLKNSQIMSEPTIELNNSWRTWMSHSEMLRMFPTKNAIAILHTSAFSSPFNGAKQSIEFRSFDGTTERFRIMDTERLYAATGSSVSNLLQEVGIAIAFNNETFDACDVFVCNVKTPQMHHISIPFAHQLWSNGATGELRGIFKKDDSAVILDINSDCSTFTMVDEIDFSPHSTILGLTQEAIMVLEPTSRAVSSYSYNKTLNWTIENDWHLVIPSPLGTSLFAVLNDFSAILLKVGDDATFNFKMLPGGVIATQ